MRAKITPDTDTFQAVKVILLSVYFSQFGIPFDDRPKMLTYCQKNKQNVFVYKPFHVETKVSQGLSNWFVFQKTTTCKIQV